MAVILGIDPGSLKTGFGLIEVSASGERYIASGIIRVPSGSLPEKLKVIHDSVAEIIAGYQPEEMAVEEVFFARDPRAALKLGQARGAAIVAGVTAALPVAEYSARTVKQSVVGNGGAGKDQVQHMVCRLLKLPSPPREDAADALAVALCHAHHLKTALALAGSGRGGRFAYARGRIRETITK